MILVPCRSLWFQLGGGADLAYLEFTGLAQPVRQFYRADWRMVKTLWELTDLLCELHWPV
jgi:hypothetical protein